jgi:hypothetical protein
MVTDCVKGIRRIGGVLSAAMFVTNSAAASPVCDIQLNAELTPDIPDPFDTVFAIGLLLGTARVVLLAPRVGSTMAVSAEAPIRAFG